MPKAVTALMRRIEREEEAKRQEQWQARRDGERGARRVWAVHSLLRAGDISPDQFDAAVRLASLLERSQEGACAGYERVDGGDSDPHARAWDRAVSAQAAKAAISYVMAAAPLCQPIVVRLFAFPQPTLGEMRRGRYRAKYERIACACAEVLGHLDAHFCERFNRAIEGAQALHLPSTPNRATKTAR